MRHNSLGLQDSSVLLPELKFFNFNPQVKVNFNRYAISGNFHWIHIYSIFSSNVTKTVEFKSEMPGLSKCERSISVN